MLIGHVSRLFHLLFADDTLIFLKANEDNCKNIFCLLHTFCEASEQEVNLQKSVVYFIANTQSVLCDSLCIILNMSKVEDPGTYINIPVV